MISDEGQLRAACEMHRAAEDMQRAVNSLLEGFDFRIEQVRELIQENNLQ